MSVVRPIGHEDRLSLVEHLDELRTRLIWSVVVFFIAFGFCYWQNDGLLRIVNKPLESSQRVECRGDIRDPLERSACFDRRLSEGLAALGPALTSTGSALGQVGRADGVPAATRAGAVRAQQQLADAARKLELAAASRPRTSGRQPVTLGVTEPFVTTITVAAYAALLLTLPFLLWQAYAFVLPAFTATERRVALPLMALIPVLFLGGVAFAYFLALPRAVDFLQNFNDQNFDILVQARDYYRFSVLLMGMMGLLFQIPVGVLALVRLGAVTTKQLRANRGYVLLAIAVVAAVATPTPDPFTMLIAMAPLLVLYELSILLAKPFEPSSPRWTWDQESADPNELD